MDLFGDDPTIFHRDTAFTDLAAMIPPDWLIDAAAGNGRQGFGPHPAGAADDWADWARLGPDIDILPDVHANGGRSHHGGGGAGDTGTVSLMSEPDGDDIIVIAYRIADWAGGGGVGEFNGPRATRDAPISEQQPYEAKADQDVVTVSRHTSLGPLTAEQRAAVQTLMASYYEWISFLQSVPSDTVIISEDGSTTTAGQALQIWALTDFVLYPAGHPFGNSGAGFANYNNGNPVVSVDVYQLVQNMRNINSIAWYFTHEIAHMTPVGIANNDAMYAPTSDGGITRTLAEFTANETFADYFGGAIAEAVGFQFPENWASPYGYRP